MVDCFTCPPAGLLVFVVVLAPTAPTAAPVVAVVVFAVVVVVAIVKPAPMLGPTNQNSHVCTQAEHG